jgi:uncharacterized protein YdhG (YjbR/CyaY superfamily)
MKQSDSVDAYLRDLPPASARIVRRVRGIVRKSVPESGEKVSYGIPAFTLDGTFMYCAAFKAHVSIFPPLHSDTALSKKLARFANERGNLRFPLGEPMPWPLITRLAKALAKQYAARKSGRRKPARKAKR